MSRDVSRSTLVCEQGQTSSQQSCEKCALVPGRREMRAMSSNVRDLVVLCRESVSIVQSYGLFNKCKYCSKLRFVQQVQVLFKATVCSTSASIVQSYGLFNKCKYCSKLRFVSTSASIVQSYGLFNKCKYCSKLLCVQQVQVLSAGLKNGAISFDELFMNRGG